VREVIDELDATFLNLDIQKQLTQKKEYQDFRFGERSVITQSSSMRVCSVGVLS
jgi:hypothetical protein